MFPSDLASDGALFLRLARADRAHARLVSIDTTRALAVPGVVAVLTAKDIPGDRLFGMIQRDQPFLAEDRVLYDGEALAVIAAETEAAAREAAALVEVTYEDLPVAGFPPAPGDPLLHDTRYCIDMDLGFGTQADAAPAHDIEIAFETPRQEHAFLETEAGIAWIEDGVLTLSVGGQSPHFDVAEIAAGLGIEQTKVRVLNPMMGGAFGGKEDMNVQFPLALATWITGRPSRLMYDRDESIRVGVKRHAFQTRCRVTADAQGHLMHADVEMLADAGAYLAYTPVVTNQATEHCTGPYKFASTKVRTRAAYTNNGIASAFRGVGGPQSLLGIEQAMDVLARQSGIDPFELRRRNLLKAGDLAGPGFRLQTDTLLAPLLNAAESGALWQGRDAYRAAAPAWCKRGVGMASVWYSYGLGAGGEAGATVRLSQAPTGRFTLELGVPDVGNGNLTAFLQIAAEGLGARIEDLDYVMGDSAGPNSGATHGSRTIYVVGNAVAKAASELRAKLDAGTDDPVVEAFFQPVQPEMLVRGIPHIDYNYIVQVTALEVDTLTGEVSVAAIENHVETGRMINPQGVEGQIDGAVAQGLGLALYEDLVLEEGRVKNPNFTNYILPTLLDLPASTRTYLYENPDRTNPLGVRGLGELGLPVTPCSIANAVADATGLRFDRFPISPQAVLDGLRQEQGK